MYSKFSCLLHVLAFTTTLAINAQDQYDQNSKKSGHVSPRFENQVNHSSQGGRDSMLHSTRNFPQMLDLQTTTQTKSSIDLKPKQNENGVKNHVGAETAPFRPASEDHLWPRVNITCELCTAAMEVAIRLVNQQKSTKDIEKIATAVCKAFDIETARVCDLVIPQFSDMVLSVVKGTALAPDTICGLALGVCPVPDLPSQWNITMSDTPKPPVKPHVLPKAGSPTLRVLHLTDIHTDIAYEPGSDAQCGEPLCCRAYDQYPAPSQSRRAGRWGDYRNCDLPFPTLERLFQHLNNISDQFDYVMFTGDLAAHDIWNQTRVQQLDKLYRVSKLFRTYLPDKPVYTCLGNHEGLPCNSFPPDTVEGHSMDWLYAAYFQAWGFWLPPSASQTIMRGGFYTFSPYPGFRIVSLNSNYGSSANWWLFLNDTDPQGQLQWLSDTLQEAEDKGEKVHILTHHPTSSLMKSFALNYYRLINRYEGTVVGQFNGHTHMDSYEVFYDLRNISRAVGASFVAGSLSPYSDSNPAYRIYTVDGPHANSSWEVLDFSHFYLDLPAVNSGQQNPVWTHEYTAKEAYRMPSLFPQDWSDLVYRMKANDTLFQQFYRHYYKSAPMPPCDAVCKRGQLCQLKTAGSGNPHLCDDL